LEAEYATCIDWDCPQNPSSWTKEQKNSFFSRASIAYEKLKDELGADVEIINEVSQSIV